MAVAEACVIKSFGHSYISCNLYYSKSCRLIQAQNESHKKDSPHKTFQYHYRIIVTLPCDNSNCARLSPSASGYMDFYISYISASLPKDADLIERAFFPCPKRHKKSTPSPALRQRMGCSCFFQVTSYGRPSAFSAHISSCKSLP